MTFRRRNVGTGSSSQDFGGEERISRRSSVLEISWSACSRCSVEENIGGGWSAVERRINDILAVKRSRNVSAENVGRFVDARTPLPRPRRQLKVVQSLFGSLDWWEISVSQYSCSLVRYEECISLTKRTHNALSDEECVFLKTLSRRRARRRRARQLASNQGVDGQCLDRILHIGAKVSRSPESASSYLENISAVES